MITRHKTVLQLHDFLRGELRAVREGESRIIRNGDGPVAVLLPCLDDGTVDLDVVAEHNKEAAHLSQERRRYEQSSTKNRIWVFEARPAAGGRWEVREATAQNIGAAQWRDAPTPFPPHHYGRVAKHKRAAELER